MGEPQEYIKQFGRFQRNARLYLISNALSGVTTGIVLVLYNLYLASLGYGTDFIGLLLFIGTLGGALAIFPAGLCIDRYGGKIVLIGASALIGCVGVGQILLRSPVPLLITAFLAGIAGACMLVVNVPFLSANSTPQERPHLFSLNIVLILVATVMGESLGGFLPLWFRAQPWFSAPLSAALASQPVVRSYQLALLFAGLIAAPSFVPLFLMRNNRTAVAPLVARAPLVALRQQLRTLSVWRHQLQWRTLFANPLIAMLAVQMLIWLGAGLFVPYFNVYFVEHLGASSALFGVIDGAANTLNALLTLLAPWLVLRLGKVTTLVVTRLLSIPLMLCIGLTHSLPFAAALYPLRQGMMDMSQGIMQVFSIEVVARQHRGLANSSYQAAFQGAYALASPIGGLIIARLGYAPVFVIASLLYATAIWLLWYRFGRDGQGGKSYEEVEETEGGHVIRS